MQAGAVDAHVEDLHDLIAKQEAMIHELQRQVNEDPLTGLANRRCFEHELDQAMAYFRRYKREGAILVIDVNDFKSVNDTLGHNCGDAILKHISKLLKAHTRQTDLVARVGGDEFVVVLREVTSTEAHLKAEELAAVIGVTPCAYEEKDVYTSISVGFCTFSEAANRQDLMDKADAAMYKNKQENRETSV